MKYLTQLTKRSCLYLLAFGFATQALPPAQATLDILFEDDFNQGIPGWTAVLPPDVYTDGPMRWQYDIVSDAFLEQSNAYSGLPAGSTNATAPLLINDAVAPANFTYKARLIAGDDDAFGLVFGYEDLDNFYRVVFTRQNRQNADPSLEIWPYTSWIVERMVDGESERLFGWGTEGFVDTFRNTQYRPFDVTITVTGENLFSLTVVDDPDGLATPYPLVENQALPAPAGGQVGIFSWGMSGTALRGFRITNLELDPVALVGNPNALEPVWTPLVTPRADGTGLASNTGNGGIPIWSLALDENGQVGTLHENSDAFGGNTADGRIDVPAAAIVAGEETWDNYELLARLIPGDDDGHGLLLRYQDEINFYRIALRAQGSGSGVKQGLSIQKVVNGLWEEVFSEETPQFIPPNNVPYDISALMIDNRLTVVILADPDSATPTRYSYGPFDIVGDTIATGKIGFFSWAMAPALQVDWVRVTAMDGVPLQVLSQYGEPTPPAGATAHEPGSTITASVESPVPGLPGVRYVVTGWTGTGSVPASGTESSVTFTLNQISSLTWNWITEYEVHATAGAGGSISDAPDQWVPEGSTVSITPQADSGYVFTGWTGSTRSVNTPLELTLNYPLTVQANFAVDSDSDGLPDDWEQLHFEGLGENAGGDSDSDGLTNLEEYQRGTSPASDETLLVDAGLASRWENVQRDPALPGQLVVRDFGSGFRGVWENSNDFRWADDPIWGANIVPNVSFDGPRLIISEEVWQPEWADSFTGSAIFSVGDNDGNCVYFRYQDNLNWYRVTVTQEASTAAPRAKVGVSVQKRVNGVFSELAYLADFYPDPSETVWYKRFRVTVLAQGQDFTITIQGWNAFFEPPVWDETFVNIPFSDPDLTSGRFGVGSWGQGGGNNATETNPVNAGVLIEDVVVEVNGEVVFSEDWEQVPLAAELPAGWEVPFTEGELGTWQVTAHGSILQSSNNTRAGEGVVLLAPAPDSANYFLELGFHPFDDDGIGFIYNFVDADNYSRVMFVSEASGAGRIPQGVNVSRKEAGVWSDILLEDRAFVYTAGSPFAVEFANNNGEYRLKVWNTDDPGTAHTLNWGGEIAPEGNRFGLTTWGETDAHFTHARAYSLPAGAVIPTEWELEGISIADGNIILTVNKSEEVVYDVEMSTTLEPGSWSVVAENQTASTWSTPLPQGEGHAFYRIRVD